MFSDNEKRVLDVLAFAGVVPKAGSFQISEGQLQEYMKVYHEMFGDSGGLKRKNHKRFARRLAGRTLLKLNFERGVKFSEVDAGLVYMIENPVFPEHYKIGMTIDLTSRIEVYQIHDPHRAFKVTKYDFVLNRKHVEKQLLNHPDMFREQGEWVKRDNAISLFEQICFIPR